MAAGRQHVCSVFAPDALASVFASADLFFSSAVWKCDKHTHKAPHTQNSISILGAKLSSPSLPTALSDRLHVTTNSQSKVKTSWLDR